VLCTLLVEKCCLILPLAEKNFLFLVVGLSHSVACLYVNVKLGFWYFMLHIHIYVT
jgi:hypothetical protein